MKAIIIAPYYYPKVGGLENYARQISLALKTIKKWEVVVITSNHKGWKSEIDTVDGIKVYRLGTWFKLYNTPLNAFWPMQIKKVIKNEKPDVLLANTPVPSLAEAAALGDRKTPFFLIYHASTLIKGNSPIFDSIARLYKLFERRLFRRADVIFAVSDYVKSQFDPKWQQKTRILSNSIWEDQIIAREQPTTSNFLFISQLDVTHSWKGLEQIIKAIAIYKNSYDPKVKLKIMGDGNYRSYYEGMVDKLDLNDNVEFLGMVKGEARVPFFLKSLALIVYPTSSNDAFPTVMLEAWGYNLPVIAAAIGPIPSLIADNADGILVEPHNPATLAKKLSQLASLNPEARAKIALSAALKVKNNYTWEIQAAKVEAVVKEYV